MKETIPHHGHSTNSDRRRAEDLQSHLAALIESVEDIPESVGFAFGTALLTMQCNCWVDRDAKYFKTCESFATAMQLGAAMFAVSGSPSGELRESLIAGKVRSLPTIGANSFANVENWITAFYLAIVCRDQARMNELCRISSGSLRTSGAADEFLYLWMDTLQKFWLQEDGLYAKLQQTIEASYAEVVEIASEGLLQTILYPPIHILHCLVFEGETQFNIALKDALELHKIYWTSDIDRLSDVAGSIALAPLAMACIAYDMNIPVNVESSYIPELVLNGNWLDGFPI
ncbi:immunity 49 family protein [Nocardia sp. NPDC059240]|uniref:immunity 49 family protein n=1 Tax=Nocardia sp. NPDC059240 TaxID=3346786 RepID=UPI0036A90C89